MNRQGQRLMAVIGGAVAVTLALGVLLTAWMVGQGSARPANAQTPAGSQITVRGSGLITATPDVLKVNVGVTVQASTVADAQTQASEIMAALAAKLKAASVTEKDYRTAQYSIEPVMDYSGKGEPNALPALLGFRVTNLLEVTLGDAATAAATLDSLVSAGANVVYVQGYTFSDPDGLRQQAYAAAVADAQAAAARLAELSGQRLGAVVSVSEAGTQPVVPVMDKGGMGGGAAVGAIYPGQQSVQVDLVVTYAASAK